MLSEKLLDLAFKRAVRHGSLEMTTAGGRRFTFGDGTEPEVSIRFTDAAAQMALCLHPELKLGELFVDGRLVIEKGTILDLLQLLLQDTHGELDELPLHRLRNVQHTTGKPAGKGAPLPGGAGDTRSPSPQRPNGDTMARQRMPLRRRRLV